MEKNDLFLVLIVILVIIHLFWPSKKENFQSWPMDYESVMYSPVANQIDGGNNFYGTRGWINPPDANNYANMIADDLNRPFASPMGGPRWDPSTWRDVQTPDGKFVGEIQSN